MTAIRSTEDHIIHKPDRIDTYSIRKRDWNKIKKDITRTTPDDFNFEAALWGCTGMAVTALLALGSLAGSSASEKIPDWIWIGNWTLLICSVLLAIIFLTFSKRRKTRVQQDSKEIVNFMDEIIAEMDIPEDN